MVFINYPKCSTCKKAEKWLTEHNIEFTGRHIVEERLDEKELAHIHQLSALPIRRLFNTSGILYREQNLKDRLESATKSEMLEILASNGMLVKRPILLGDDFALIGFKENQWQERLPFI